VAEEEEDDQLHQEAEEEHVLQNARVQKEAAQSVEDLQKERISVLAENVENLLEKDRNVAANEDQKVEDLVEAWKRI
jgi:hypothetical protein